MKLSVVILTCTQWDILRRCLLSLREALTDIPSEIIVIDNASTDDTPRRLATEFPEVHLIVNAQNRGVAMARNQGLRVARGEYILILDNDTVVPPTAIRGMLAYMDAHPECGLLGPGLENEDGTLQQSAKPFPSFVIKVRHILGMGDGPERPMEYVIGACQLFHSNILKEVGLLDEKIFYGPEDADFCLHISASGRQIHYRPEIRVQHLYRRRTRRNPFSRLALRHIRALFYFYRKYRRLR